MLLFVTFIIIESLQRKERVNGMMLKPKHCCECGTYEHAVPMAIHGRVRDIDYCVADIVAALNASGIATDASCCGHGEQESSIILADGRHLRF